MKLIGIAASVVLVSAVAVAGFVVNDLAHTFGDGAVALEGQESLPPDLGAYTEGFDLLLVGLDVCEQDYAYLFGDRCPLDEDGILIEDDNGTLNDVNLLVHVSSDPRRVTAVSFPRDLQIPIPSCVDADGDTREAMSKQPLNSAYQYGELACVASTITQLTGQDIEFAASVTFGGVIEITNAVGGVEVCLASPIVDPDTDLDLPAGEHTIAGVEALKFLRTRHGVGNGSDLSRIGNQQQYLSSLVRKVSSDEVLRDTGTLMRLVNTAFENVTPSQSLTNPILLAQLALALKSVPVEEITFVQYPTLWDPENPNHVIPDTASADILWDAIRANTPLQITHQPGEDDGVVLADDGTGAPAPPPTEGAEPAPVTTLPPEVSGNRADQRTCSNGNG
nr:LCP family protein [Microbacterium pseudoresistens]